MREEIRSMIGARLKAERERLGLAQEDLATIADASRRSVVDWERGVTVPGADNLALLAGRSFDVLFVVTGAKASTSSGTLSLDETRLVDDYRRATSEHQRTLRDVVAVFSQIGVQQPSPPVVDGDNLTEVPGHLVRKRVRKAAAGGG